MQTTVEKLDATRAKLTISVTPEELRPSIDQAYKTIATQVNIPGFRAGKVPPPIIDQRIGRDQVLNQAVTESLDTFYRQGVAEAEVRPIGRPSADVATWPDMKTFEGDLVIEVEVDVRPDFDMPKIEGRKVEVESIEVADADIEEELTKLRSRFGTLTTVDAPAAKGHFVQLDLVAKIDGETVDTADGISYEVGSGELIDGIDEAVDSLTAGEETTFTSTLVGGDNAGKDAEVSVKVLAVKERELPEADDDFAQLASQFDTIDELKDDLKTQVERQKKVAQFTEARTKLQEALIAEADIPVPATMVEEEVTRHLEGEGRLEDDEHRAEVKESTESQLRSQILFDRLAEDNDLQVSQAELSQYVVQNAAQYGMPPQEFVEILEQNGQLPVLLSDLLRGKALNSALRQVEVVDAAGAAVDLSEFVPAEAPAEEAAAEEDESNDDK
ncbi:trigger factor [Humidisolicoccus flavus]|uniref:trigger factor n=1 Tax=Humidisolicoccus flavus TaxID=3111414 RepID=UPI003249C5F8